MPPASTLPSSLTSYLSCHIVQLHTLSRSGSGAINLTKLIDLLAVSYMLSSMLPACSLASSLTLYSSHRVVQLPTVCPSENCVNNLAKFIDLLAVSYVLSSMLPVSSPPFSLTSYLSHRVVQLPTVSRSESCTNNFTNHIYLHTTSYLVSSTLPAYSRHRHWHHIHGVILYNFPLSVSLRGVLTISQSTLIFSPRLTAIIHVAGIVTAIVIDVLLVASYSSLSLRTASSLVSTSLMFSLHHVSSGKLPLLLSHRLIPSTLTWYIDIH